MKALNRNHQKSLKKFKNLFLIPENNPWFSMFFYATIFSYDSSCICECWEFYLGLDCTDDSQERLKAYVTICFSFSLIVHSWCLFPIRNADTIIIEFWINTKKNLKNTWFSERNIIFIKIIQPLIKEFLLWPNWMNLSTNRLNIYRIHQIWVPCD